MKRYLVPTRSALTLRVLVEIVSILLLIYPMLHIYVFIDLPPYKRGFYCNDESIKKPDLHEEITVNECILIWVAIVVAVVPAIEMLHVTVFEHNEGPRIWKFPWVVIELYRILGYFALGSLCTLLTTELAKFKVGRLRPYFLTVCKPDLSDDVCKDEHGYYKFVTEYTCKASDKEVHEASKSFLSGHSSFSAYCATFLIVYIHARFRNIANNDYRKSLHPKKGFHTLNAIFKGLKVLRPFLQFGIFCLAFYIMLSRISDYKHHPGDVLTGAAVGVAFAVTFLIFMMDLFVKPRIFKCVEEDTFCGGDHPTEEFDRGGSTRMPMRTHSDPNLAGDPSFIPDNNSPRNNYEARRPLTNQTHV
jgi:phosphatidate phosphatase